MDEITVMKNKLKWIKNRIQSRLTPVKIPQEPLSRLITHHFNDTNSHKQNQIGSQVAVKK